MREIMEFLSFQHFISFPVLLVCYYLGSLGIPLMSWYAASRLKEKYWVLAETQRKGGELVRRLVRPRDRAVFVALVLFIFLSMEIMWRMIFEYLIAYLQMRDALLKLTG